MLVTHSLGAMPILRRLLRRMRLHEFLQQHLPAEDGHTQVDTARVVNLLVTNLLISREPVYGVADWARDFDPELFDLQPKDIERLNDDHRPDLKQLLYILTVSNDGGVPIYFQAASGNVVDDQTHQATVDVLSVCTEEQVSKEGYRLFWYHSLRKQQTDAATRARHVQRTLANLTTLRERLGSPRTRFRTRDKVQTTIDEILTEHAMTDLVQVTIVRDPCETRPHGGSPFSTLDRRPIGETIYGTNWRCPTSLRVRRRAKSLENFKTKVRGITRRSHNLDAEMIEKLNRVIRVAANYFATPWSHCGDAYRSLDRRIRMRLRCMKTKRKPKVYNSRIRWKHLRRLGLLSLSDLRLASLARS